MTIVPSVSYLRIIAAFKRLGFETVRQRGSHIRMKRVTSDGRVTLITIPAHHPVYSPTLAKILKQASISIESFLEVL